MKEFLVLRLGYKYSTQAVKSWNSFLNGEADKISKGGITEKIQDDCENCKMNGLDEKVQIKILYLEHVHVLHGLLAVSIDSHNP